MTFFDRKRWKMEAFHKERHSAAKIWRVDPPHTKVVCHTQDCVPWSWKTAFNFHVKWGLCHINRGGNWNSSYKFHCRYLILILNWNWYPNPEGIFCRHQRCTNFLQTFSAKKKKEWLKEAAMSFLCPYQLLNF
jgi:hypothetical protein